MDFPRVEMPPPPVLTPFHPDSLGFLLAPELQSATASILSHATSTTWLFNDRAYYYPFRLFAHAVAQQLLFWVGATSSGNIDVGIYDAGLRKIVSAGSTAMSATVNTVQEINITDTPLPPGDYWLAAACDNSTGTGFRNAVNDELVLPVVPLYEEVGAFPLPATATPILLAGSSGPLWVCGIQFVPTF